MSKRIDLVGKSYGRLTVEEYAYTENKRAHWICVCDCGEKTVVSSNFLRTGNTKSCGCLRKEVLTRTTHGMGKTPEYRAWAKMKERCMNVNNKSYKDYGGRGIEVCERWMTFENFYTDMGKKPSSKHSIDRIDNDKGYSPDNCRWVTMTTQIINQRLKSTNTSGSKGVYYSKTSRKWIANIKYDNKSYYLGSFEKIEDAIETRKQAEFKYWGSQH